jgi:ABC-type multidrug transport system ATPase subunit
MIQLEVKDLVKRFGKKIVLQTMNFSENSSVLGIAGKNGSGKSTLLRCLSYLTGLTKGTVVWKNDGIIIHTSLFKNNLGYAAPYLNLYAEFSAIENISFHAKLKQITSFDVSDWATRLDVQFSLDQPFGALSSGQQQRVKLLSAFALQPKIILLDEPGTNLDESGKQAVYHSIVEARKWDAFIIIASNDPEELSWCDKVIRVGQ